MRRQVQIYLEIVGAFGINNTKQIFAHAVF